MIELRDKLALKGDLEIARQIQFGLLPFEPFHRDGTSIYAAMRPANTVGGDYFDIIELGEGRVAIAMGDVAGKGIPAALLMALLQGSLRTLLSAGLRGADLMRTLNAHLLRQHPQQPADHALLRRIRPGHGSRSATSTAGTTRPSSCAPGGVERLPATGMALGHRAGRRLRVLRDRARARRAAVPLHGRHHRGLRCRGARVRRGAAGGACWSPTRALAPPELIEGVREDVLAFCGTVRPRDDMTMMVVAR